MNKHCHCERKRSNLYLLFHRLPRPALAGLAMTLTVLFTLTSVVHAQTASTWQNSATGLKTSVNTDKKTAGLSTIIQASGIPFMSLQGGVKWGGNSRVIGPANIDLGEIKAIGTSPTIASESADWAHNEMTFSNNLKIWISRLSPSVLIQNLNNSLRILSGNLNTNKFVAGSVIGEPWTTKAIQGKVMPVYPKYVAYSTSGAIQVKQIPASSSASLNLPVLDNNWVLIWYGNNSYSVETKLPLSYSNITDNYANDTIPLTLAYQADAPILLKFENNPTSIKNSPEGGVDLTFATNSGYTGVMPLFGREHLKASDTEGWGTISTLPITVVSKINFWTSKLCSYPTNVLETYDYDATTDTAKISENITYLPVCSGGSTTSGFAILPPMLAIAKDALGTNFSVSKTLTDAAYPTEFGPILGVDNTNTYSYSVKGLKKYTDNKRVLSNGTVPNELTQELTKQVDEATKSGHFAPWMFSDHNHMSDIGELYFANPGDIIYYLSEIIPVLPEPQKTNLINYLKSEKNNFPPETVYNLSLTQGKLRAEYASLPTLIIAGQTNEKRWQSYRQDVFLNSVPLYNFYALSNFYDLTGDAIPSSVMTSAISVLDKHMAEQDWADLYWFNGLDFENNLPNGWYTHSTLKQTDQRKAAVTTANRHFAGLVGLVNLARKTNDKTTENLSRALLAKAVVSRIAFLEYPSYQYTSKLIDLMSLSPNWQVTQTAGNWYAPIVNYNWQGAADDQRQMLHFDQFESYLYDHSGTPRMFSAPINSSLISYKDMVPELYRLLGDFDKAKAEIYLKKFEAYSPTWYQTLNQADMGLEHGLNHPSDASQLFLAKALISHDTPQNLAKYISFPWLQAGDFFYMQKLAETIKAYQGWAWSDTLTGQPCTLSSASWSPVTTTTGQTVNLNAVATGDCSGKTVTFEVRRNGVGDDLSAITKQPNPQLVSFNGGNQVSNTWVAEHNPFIPLTDPDYYFKATLSGGNVINTTQLLHVTSPVGGGPTPTPTQPASTPTSVPPTPTKIASTSATPIPTVTPTPVPCTLASAAWSTTTTTQGSTVNLNVVGNTNCAGKQVSFEVRRNGVTIDDIPANIQPQTASMSASLQASTTWVSERNPLIPFTDAQYYFKATPQGGLTINTKPQLLTVTQAIIVPTAPNDWPQVQKDPQHTGYSAETLGTNFKVKFTYAFQPDRVYPQVQAIIYQGKAFVGTEGANGQKPTLYAIDAVNIAPNTNPPKGIVLWKFEAGGPILNSVAAYDNKIFFGSLDGAVYALNSSNGAQIWKNQLSSRLGFSTAPVIADNKVMLGGQDGNFYALDPNDGHIIWKYNAGSSILQTAAYDQGKAFFGTKDMYVHGVNTANGTRAWKSQRIPGLGFKDYWPVVTQGKVLIIPMAERATNGIKPGFPFKWFDCVEYPSQCTWLATNGQTIATGGATLVPDVMNSQNTIMASYQANPGSYTKNLFILDANTGQEAMSVPHTAYQTMNGAATPPCVDREGKLIVPIVFINSRWGRLDLTKARITDILYDGLLSGGGNYDENMSVSCTANEILAFHFMEGNANYTGAFNLDNRKWTQIGAGMKNGQMETNTQGGGTNPASISNGMIYHISIHELVVRSTN